MGQALYLPTAPRSPLAGPIPPLILGGRVVRRAKSRLERMRLSRPGWRYLHLNRDTLEVNESSIARSQAKGRSAIPPRILEYRAIAIGHDFAPTLAATSLRVYAANLSGLQRCEAVHV